MEKETIGAGDVGTLVLDEQELARQKAAAEEKFAQACSESVKKAAFEIYQAMKDHYFDPSNGAARLAKPQKFLIEVHPNAGFTLEVLDITNAE